MIVKHEFRDFRRGANAAGEYNVDSLCARIADLLRRLDPDESVTVIIETVEKQYGQR